MILFQAFSSMISEIVSYDIFVVCAGFSAFAGVLALVDKLVRG